MDNESSTISYPNQSGIGESIASIASLLREATKTLPILRREFRGEALVQYSDGTQTYIQVSKPLFVKVDHVNNLPKKQKVSYKNEDGSTFEKEIYVPNDEAIEEVLSILKFMGLNQVTPITVLDEGTILDDLKEFECKLAALLCLKQKAWGIDKEELPMLQTKIKTIVQDARYQAKNGNTLKAIQRTISTVEQSVINDKNNKNKFTPYN